MGRYDELKIQQTCYLWLNSMGVFCHSIPNEADGRSMVAQQMLINAGLRPGVADMLVWWPRKNGGVRLGYLEFKTRTGKQSERQKVFEEKCKEKGIPYDLARSLEDVQQIMARRVSEDGEC